MYKQQSVFHLKHADICNNSLAFEASEPTAGYWSEGKTTTTWYIDLEKIVGYETFNNTQLFGLRLNQTSFTAENFSQGNEDTQLLAYIEGLQWENCNYDVATNQNTNKAVLSVFNITNIAITTSYPPNVSVLNFKKTSPRVKITISYVRLRDLTAPLINENTTIPNGVFQFSIFPIR